MQCMHLEAGVREGKTTARRVPLALAMLLAASCAPAARAETPPWQSRATEQLDEFFRRRVARIEQAEPANAASLEAWQRQRELLRRQLQEMLGLWPEPTRGDLQASVVGQLESDGVICERLHFQSLPGLYVTANFYRPREADAPLPTILYLNGHGRAHDAGRSLGNKVYYQHHPGWFARQGYCCLTIDTLQLGEIEGVHHGTYRLGMWWWICRGYTPAGVEAWNAIRALDYLETRPEVDARRIGVTGRSGGGAHTWWLAGLDDRPACLVPVAGITDLEDHVVGGCIEGHCDCMYAINHYRWDFSTLACLAAPRPCLLANTDKDPIFPLGGVARIHSKLRAVYELHGAADRLGLFISEGPHGDTQELQLAAFRWMNRWLRDTSEPVTLVAEKLSEPAALAVFESLPVDQLNTTIQESFVPAAEPGPPPATLGDWNAQRERLLAELAARTFAGSPAAKPELDLAQVADETAGDRRLRVVEFTSQDNLRLTMLVAGRGAEKPPERVRLEVGGDGEWTAWSARIAAAFPKTAEHLGLTKTGPTTEGSQAPGSDASDAAEPAGEATATQPPENGDGWPPEDEQWAIVWPRGWGLQGWAGDEKAQRHRLRRFVLLGTTADEGRIWDVRMALDALQATLGPSASLTIAGRGPAAGIALYSGLFEPAVKEFELADPAASHREAPILINVLRVLDAPQALALAFPRSVRLTTSERAPWAWTEAVAALYQPDAMPLNIRASERPLDEPRALEAE